MEIEFETTDPRCACSRGLPCDGARHVTHVMRGEDRVNTLIHGADHRDGAQGPTHMDAWGYAPNWRDQLAAHNRGEDRNESRPTAPQADHGPRCAPAPTAPAPVDYCAPVGPDDVVTEFPAPKKHGAPVTLDAGPRSRRGSFNTLVRGGAATAANVREARWAPARGESFRLAPQAARTCACDTAPCPHWDGAPVKLSRGERRARRKQLRQERRAMRQGGAPQGT